jgi:hypothetical protein
MLPWEWRKRKSREWAGLFLGVGALGVRRVLPRYHGRLSEESCPLLLPFESPPLARIMTPLDVVKDIGPGLGSRPVILPIHPLTFEHPKKLSTAVLLALLLPALMLQMT